MKKLLLAFSVVLFVLGFSMPTQAQVNTNDIKFWVGTGSNTSYLVINWSYANTALVYGYRWNTTDAPTVADMMRAVGDADPNLTCDLSAGYLDDWAYVDQTCLNLSLSGWDSDDFGYFMYAVNGIQAGVGCEGYNLADGDLVHWRHSSDFAVGAVDPTVTIVYPVAADYAVVTPVVAHLCATDVYTDYGFNIVAADFAASTTAYTDSNKIVVGCAADTLYRLSFYVEPSFDIHDTLQLAPSQLPYQYGEITIEEGTTTSVQTFPLESVNGCDSTVHLHLTIADVPASVSENGINQGVEVFMNQIASIHIASVNPMSQLALYNVNGSLVYSERIDNTTADLSVETLPSAIYLLKIKLANGTIVIRKIVF